MSEKVAEATERLRRQFTGPMSEEEIEFLRDVQATIDYAIRNGFSFPMIAATLGHDVHELMVSSYSMEAARARGVKFKVPVYGKFTPDDVGDSLDESA